MLQSFILYETHGGKDMFPHRLRELRLEKKRTQKEMAAFLDITRQGYGNYENGVTEPDQKTLNRLADYFEVSVDYLLGRAEEPQAQSLEDDFDPNINVAYLGGVKYELTPEVARRLKEDIELFKRLKEQHLKDK
jgi:transcriptional regulator with XRE-family HTH domain